MQRGYGLGLEYRLMVPDHYIETMLAKIVAFSTKHVVMTSQEIKCKR